VGVPAEIRAGKSKIKGESVDQCKYLNLISISYLIVYKLVWQTVTQSYINILSNWS
jgi:hypothetical protein